MFRAAFPSGRKTLLALVLTTAIGGGAWWWMQPHPPREPVSHGRPISQWVFTVNYGDEESGIEAGDAQKHLPNFGAAGVTWLALQVEHGRRPFMPNGPLPFDKAPDWLRRWISDRWGGLRVSATVDERGKAAYALGLLREKAAPAIPALVRSLNEEGQASANPFAWALYAIGPAAWPAIHEGLAHGSAIVRAALISEIATRVGTDDDPASDTEMARIAETCVKAFSDPNAHVRMLAAYAIADCRRSSPKSACFEVAIPGLIRLLSDANPEARAGAVDALGNFGASAAPAVPRLIELLDDPSAEVRFKTALALQGVDQLEKRSVEKLRIMLANDPERDCRMQAAQTLKELGISTDVESIGGKESPAR